MFGQYWPLVRDDWVFRSPENLQVQHLYIQPLTFHRQAHLKLASPCKWNTLTSRAANGFQHVVITQFLHTYAQFPEQYPELDG